MEHWDGWQWKVVPSPNPTTHYPNGLYALSGLSASDIWAVGYTYNNEARYQTLAEHWDGSRWSVVNTPSTDVHRDNYLYGVAAASTKDIWAVGYAEPTYNSPGPLVERYNDPCAIPTATPAPHTK